MKMSNKVYDVLKWIALIAIPFVDLLSAVLPIWGCPEWLSTALVTTVSAVGLFCGAVIAVSTIEYYKEIDDAEVKG